MKNLKTITNKQEIKKYFKVGAEIKRNVFITKIGYKYVTLSNGNRMTFRKFYNFMRTYITVRRVWG
jgi:hypothetical protein